MTIWRHDLVQADGADLHITVCFRDWARHVRNPPIDHHSTLYFTDGSKFHYGWKFGIFHETRDSPCLEAQILLFELFKYERSRLYDRRVIDRMYS